MTAPRPTLLLTRPEPASRRFRAQLDPSLVTKISVLISPLIQILPVNAAIPAGGYGGLIFSSASAVAVVSSRLTNRSARAWCVGPATTAAARDAGWDATEAGQDADALVAHLQDVKPAGPLLHLRGTHARGDIAARLAESGIPTDELVIYDQQAQPLTDAAQAALAGPVIAPLFSPRTARLLAEAAPEGPIRIAAMSEAVAAAARTRPDWQITVADAPNADAMRALVEKLLQKALPG